MSEARERGPFGAAEARALLRRQPLFRDVGPEAIGALEGRLSPRRWADGEALLEEGQGARDALFLDAGEVAVRAGGRLVATLDGPCALGLLSIIDGEPRSATVTAMGSVEGAALAQEDLLRALAEAPALYRSLIRHLTRELRDAQARQRAQARNLDDFFAPPNARIVPGPYRFPEFPMTIVVLEADPRALAALLPPGLSLVPGLGGRVVLALSAFTGAGSLAAEARGKRFDYQEATPFVPCLGPWGRPGAFVPELYPDNYLAIAVGRELYGFPKRYGRTAFREHGADLFLDDRLVLRARWARARDVAPERFAAGLARALLGDALAPPSMASLGGALFGLVARRPEAQACLPDVPVFVRKQIADESSLHERTLEIDELVEVPFTIESLGPFAELEEASLATFDAPPALSGRCLGAFRARMAMRFGRGKSLRDYLAEGKAPEGPLGRAAALARRWWPLG